MNLKWFFYLICYIAMKIILKSVGIWVKFRFPGEIVELLKHSLDITLGIIIN